MRIVLLALLGLSVIACDKKKDEEDDGMGSAAVVFDNSTADLRLDDAAGYPEGSTGVVDEHGESRLTWPATTFASKMVNILLVEDLGENGQDNVGNGSNIWINPACDILVEEDGSSRIEGGECDTTKITTLFEFGRPSAEVNAELNSQQMPIHVGTYRYVRVTICDNTITEDNVTFTSVAAGVDEPFTMRTGNCFMTPAKIDPPIELAEGESIAVSLKYDLSTALIDMNYDVATKTYQDNPVGECVFGSDGKALVCPRDFTYLASAKKIAAPVTE